MTNARQRICVALDGSDRAWIVARARELGSHVGWLKLGLEAFTAFLRNPRDAETRHNLGRGYRAIKMKVGREDLAEDVEFLRRAVEPNDEDAHQDRARRREDDHQERRKRQRSGRRVSRRAGWSGLPCRNVSGLLAYRRADFEDQTDSGTDRTLL